MVSIVLLDYFLRVLGTDFTSSGEGLVLLLSVCLLTLHRDSKLSLLLNSTDGKLPDLDWIK